MPIYEYKCEACSHIFEIHRSVNEPDAETCEKCSGPVRRVFSPVGIAFKGSGFYINDSKKSGKSTVSSSPSGDSTPAKETEAKKDTETKPADSSSGGAASGGTAGGGEKTCAA